MKTREKQLAVDMLKDYARRQSHDCCNDWAFPEGWTRDQQVEFVKEYHEWNGDPESFNPNFLYIADFAVVLFLAHKLEAEIETSQDDSP